MSKGKAKKPPPPPAPKPPYAKTYLSGPERIIQVIEDLRTLDSDGYATYGAGFLAKIKNYRMAQTKGTVCSPFTGNVIGCAFDPDYEKKNVATDEFQPMFNGGADPLPFAPFYKQHNEDDQPAQSVEKYNLGYIVKPKELRRGDVIGIDWSFGGGHAVFCWDVHVNEKTGDVDCFQYVGANGHLAGQLFDHDEKGLAKAQATQKAGTGDKTYQHLGGYGVSIAGCAGETWLKGKPATFTTEVKEVEVPNKKKVKDPTTGKVPDKIPKYKVVAVSTLTQGNLSKAKDKIFVDSDDISKTGQWHCIPGVKKKDVDPNFVKNRSVHEDIKDMHCARFWYSKDPPKPAEHKPAAPVPPPPEPKNAGHTEAPAQVVKGDEIKQNPQAKAKVKPVPAKQESDKTLNWQHFVEHALQVFYAAKWIDKDPGKSDDINDPKTQAALKAYQTLFDLKVDGKIGKQTLGSMIVELPICVAHVAAQYMLQRLWGGEKISSDPGVADGTNHDKTKAAVEEFQKKHGLKPTKVPDSATHKKLKEVVASHAPTPDKPGLTPQVTHLYWVGNTIDAGGSGRLRLHSVDLKSCEVCTIHLHDETSNKDVDATVNLSVDDTESEANVPIPFGEGASVQAKVVTQSAGEISTAAALHVGRGLETADWRSYVDQDSVPDEIIDKIKRNRARWPLKTINLVKKPPKYVGAKHYDYGPPPAHGQWARDYITKEKVEKATTLPDKHVAQVFVDMMRSEKGAEGQPASFQTYDNQIVTWGVGFGGMGDGVYIFDELNTDAKMQRLLDDLGVQYFGGRYHVVHLTQKKVISSVEITKEKKGKKRHVGWAHKTPLDAWRDQMDAMSAIISISEDPAYRTQILEAQWRVYLRNSSTWTGQDKIYTFALFYMITHSQHWLPALAKGGYHVNKEWETIGAKEPSVENDKKLAQRLLNSYLQYGKDLWNAKGPWKEVYGRVKTDLWARFKTDAKKEGFDPGEFVYTVDE